MHENHSGNAAGLTTDCAQMPAASIAPTASLHTYEIYTDGSALVGTVPKGARAEGPGGWAVRIVRSDGEVREASGGLPCTTSVRAEMTAAIQALSRLREDRCGVVRSDSVLVVRGVTAWRRGWEAKDFKDVKNADLWRTLYALADARPGIVFAWVKGHAEDKHNQRVDHLARRAALTIQKETIIAA